MEDKNQCRVRSTLQYPAIVTDIKVHRLRWLGHVERMANQRVPKNVLTKKPEGCHSAGHPRLRWPDDVEAETYVDGWRKLGIRNWRRLADTSCRKTLALNGL